MPESLDHDAVGLNAVRVRKVKSLQEDGRPRRVAPDRLHPPTRDASNDSFRVVPVNGVRQLTVEEHGVVDLRCRGSEDGGDSVWDACVRFIPAVVHRGVFRFLARELQRARMALRGRTPSRLLIKRHLLPVQRFRPLHDGHCTARCVHPSIHGRLRARSGPGPRVGSPHALLSHASLQERGRLAGWHPVLGQLSRPCSDLFLEVECSACVRERNKDRRFLGGSRVQYRFATRGAPLSRLFLPSVSRGLRGWWRPVFHFRVSPSCFSSYPQVPGMLRAPTR